MKTFRKFQALALAAALFSACRAERNETDPIGPLQRETAEAAEKIPEPSFPAEDPPAENPPARGAPVTPAALVMPEPAARRGAGGSLVLPGGIRGRPGMGVFTEEIDPVNYKTASPGVLLSMGVERHVVSYIMGERYFRAREYAKAIAEYNGAIALKADFAEAFFSRGRASHERGDLDGAVADYTAAIALAGGYAAAYNCRGCAYAQKGEGKRAIEDYTRAIALKRDYGDAWFNRGYSYREQGEYDRAAADFSALIELEPENAAAYNQRGTARYYRGEDTEAAADFSRAIALKRDFSLAWYNRGIARRSLGETDKAEADLAEARRLGYRPPDLQGNP
ncbi:MAG: tetratricopeptide repeat protein [Treponema sp.]|jgi:Flp pilus assembly protein TadD|nr:tetratricopeptide repeat protein [Treponema sp.]